MSFQTFHIGNLKVGSFIEGIHLERGIKELFQKNETKILLEASTQGVILVNNFRSALISPTANLLLDVIPGDWDTKLRDELVNVVFPKVISIQTKLLPCAQQDTVEKQALCLFDYAANLDDDVERAKLYHGLAATFAHEIILLILGQPLDINSIFVAIVTVFKKLFGK